jgi:hypothetical protein
LPLIDNDEINGLFIDDENETCSGEVIDPPLNVGGHHETDAREVVVRTKSRVGAVASVALYPAWVFCLQC